MSFKTQLRKLSVIGAIFSLALTAGLASSTAQAAAAAPVQVSTTLTEPKFIAEFNGGLYFTASTDSGTSYNVYFYDGKGDPQLVNGGTNTDEMDRYAVKFQGDLYFTTQTAAYKITKGKTLSVAKAWASLVPDHLTVIGKNLYFTGFNSNQARVLHKWDGKTANPVSLEGVGNSPMGSRHILVAGNRLAMDDENRNLWLSTDAGGTANPVFTHIDFQVNGGTYETEQAYGFVKIGNKLFFNCHETYNSNYTVMYVDVSNPTPSQAQDPHFANGDVMGNASAPVRLGTKVYLVGSRVPANGGTAGGRTLYTINDAGDFEEAPGFTGANANIQFAGNTWGGDINYTDAQFFALGGRVFLTDSNDNVYTYKNDTLSPLTYNGNQLSVISGVATVGKKIMFGAYDASAASGSDAQNPIFTMNVDTGVVTAVTSPNHLRGIFAAFGHLFFRAQVDANSPETLWVDEKIAAPAEKATKVAGFYGDSSWLNPVVTKKVKALLTSPSAITAVVCTGSTAGTKASAFDKKLALARAKATCAYIKTIAKNAKVTSVAKPATGAAYSNRAVEIAITR